jgi:hypothetical protein
MMLFGSKREEVRRKWEQLHNEYIHNGSRDSAVGIATGRGVGARVPIGARNFTSSRRPDRLWGPPSLLSNGYGGLFPRG